MSTAPLLTGLPALPLPRTSLIGREAEVAAVRALLQRDDVPLVTLLGPGGVGKTRLALEMARSVGDAFPDGVVFVSLAPVRDSALVLPTIARALDVGDRGARPLPEQLAAWLGGQRLLLVLDNLEQVVSAAPQLSGLLGRCPALTILATSRFALRVSGEHRYRVSPLDLPDLTKLPAPAALAGMDAVTLFIQRAQAEDPSFTLTMENAPVVAEICARLDGLPLAIELAVARLGVLSPEGLLARLSDRLRLLTGGQRDQPARLQTMRNAIAWSHELLSPPEQTLFRRLAVFAGDFTMDGAEAVAGDGEIDVADTLAALVDQSLVRRLKHPAGKPRLGMLETIREFALEQLVECGEEAEVRSRHLAYYLEMAEEADRVPYTPQKEKAARRLEADLPNLRAALEWATAQVDSEYLLRLVVALWWFWEARVSLREACDWVDRAVAATAQAPPTLAGQRARLLFCAAMGAIWQASIAGVDALLDEALTLARQSGDERAIIEVLIGLGHLAIDRGELDRAEPLLLEALERSRAWDEPGRSIESLWRLGYLYRHRGEQEASEALWEEMLTVARAGGWHVSISYALESLGTSARERGDQVRAASLFAEALSLGTFRSEPGFLANCLRSLGAVAASAGRAEQAARLFGASKAIFERYGYGVASAERALQERGEAPARHALSASAFNAAWDAGRALPLDEAIAEALAVADEVTAARPATTEALAGLTPREREVLGLVAQGRSNREIAEQLFISVPTVKAHMTSIFTKLDLKSRAAATAFAIHNGLA